jgi:hypothetical protein
MFVFRGDLVCVVMVVDFFFFCSCVFLTKKSSFLKRKLLHACIKRKWVKEWS